VRKATTTLASKSASLPNTKTLIAFQQPDGTIERWYGDGNWSRTLLLYAMWKTQGCYLDGWEEGVQLGAVPDGPRLLVSVVAPARWKGRLHLDYARHKRTLNFDRDYVLLNEWPEWFTVDEIRLYRHLGRGERDDPPGLGAQGWIRCGGQRAVDDPARPL